MLGNLYSFFSVTITKSEESTDFSRTTPVMILSIAPTLVERIFRSPLQGKQAFLQRNLCFGCLFCIFLITIHLNDICVKFDLFLFQ